MIIMVKEICFKFCKTEAATTLKANLKWGSSNYLSLELQSIISDFDEVLFTRSKT